MREVGFLLNVLCPADVRHVAALREVIVQAVKQAGGEEGRAVDFADRAAALIRDVTSATSDGDPLHVALELGPPIQVVAGGRTLTLDPS